MDPESNPAPALADPVPDLHANMKPADLTCPGVDASRIQSRGATITSRREQAAAAEQAAATESYYTKWCANPKP